MRSRGRLLAAARILALIVGACGGDRPASPTIDQVTVRHSGWFTEEAAAAGLDFVHFNGMSGEFFYPEMFGPGVALVDIDNDGDLDLYVVQGQMLGRGRTTAEALLPPEGRLRDRLFRNDLTVHPDGTRTLRFTDITEQSGIDIRSYGMGVAVGDFDNDGWIDIYRTGLDGGVLLRNNGDGTFTDVTENSDTANRGSWGVSASFVDYDRDGWLDLFIGNYLEYSVDRDVACFSVTGQRDYCPPHTYRPQMDRLYRSRGDGTFEDVTARALAGGAHGPALGVSAADFDGDGWIDIYVANDGQPNQLWMNQRDGTFKDMAFLNGAAVNGAGAPEASMGIDAGDFDNDGDEDLFITNWISEMNILYRNIGGGVFEDRKAASGLGPPSVARTGFGTAWFDFDNDGWLDLLAVNGSVATIDAQAREGDPFPFRMPNQLYRNLGNGRFEDVSARGGPPFGMQEVSRGAAFGDIDNDGYVDVVIGNAAGPLHLVPSYVWREIFTDGRELPPDPHPTWMGYSVGHWDGDAFIVRSAGFNGKAWLNSDGWPTTEALRVTERLQRKDFGNMDLEITIDDHQAYTRPWTLVVPLVFYPDSELMEYVCTEHNKFLELLPRH